MEAEARKPLRILIADDDGDIRELLETLIEREPDMELAGVATDGAEAMTLADEVEPDVVVLDWAMPGATGDAAAAALTAKYPDLRIVAISAMAGQEASYVMQTAGAVAFVQKPFTKEQMLEAIRSAARW